MPEIDTYVNLRICRLKLSTTAVSMQIKRMSKPPTPAARITMATSVVIIVDVS